VEAPAVEEPAADEPVFRDTPGEEAKFHHEVDFIEGIGPKYGAALKEQGIETPLALLESGATPKGRKKLAEKTGISAKLILTWVNQADLMRIKGIGSQYADLLEEAGVDTVPELARRNPSNLHEKVVEINEEKHFVRHSPGLHDVEAWIAEAKELPRVVKY
jgi:predicted flap endonuclease-1-like 5' DNA nuclease